MNPDEKLLDFLSRDSAVSSCNANIIDILARYGLEISAEFQGTGAEVNIIRHENLSADAAYKTHMTNRLSEKKSDLLFFEEYYGGRDDYISEIQECSEWGGKFFAEDNLELGLFNEITKNIQGHLEYSLDEKLLINFIENAFHIIDKNLNIEVLDFFESSEMCYFQHPISIKELEKMKTTFSNQTAIQVTKEIVNLPTTLLDKIYNKNYKSFISSRDPHYWIIESNSFTLSILGKRTHDEFWDIIEFDGQDY